VAQSDAALVDRFAFAGRMGAFLLDSGELISRWEFVGTVGRDAVNRLAYSSEQLIGPVVSRADKMAISESTSLVVPDPPAVQSGEVEKVAVSTAEAGAGGRDDTHSPPVEAHQRVAKVAPEPTVEVPSEPTRSAETVAPVPAPMVETSAAKEDVWGPSQALVIADAPPLELPKTPPTISIAEHPPATATLIEPPSALGAVDVEKVVEPRTRVKQPARSKMSVAARKAPKAKAQSPTSSNGFPRWAESAFGN
jgi:hypothetical protein